MFGVQVVAGSRVEPATGQLEQTLPGLWFENTAGLFEALALAINRCLRIFTILRHRIASLKAAVPISPIRFKMQAEVACGWSGVLVGAKAFGSVGATIGTFVAPDLGTAVGGAIGGIVGSTVSYMAGSKLGSWLVDFASR
jgi:hypothetical protein